LPTSYPADFPRSFLFELIPGCQHFVWKEVLYLRRWDVHALPGEEQYHNLIEIAQKLELVRDLFKSPIHITSGLRPGLYNTEIGGAKDSAHKYGMALDFVVGQFRNFSSCNFVRDKIKPHLENFDIYMEDLCTADWLHIQTRPTKSGSRFFRP
jgi:hypothetical protein